MAATATAAKLSANLKVNIKSTTDSVANIAETLFPDEGAAGTNLWLDMRDYEHVMFIVVCKLLTDDLEDVRINSNSASDGSGTDYEVVASTDPITDQDAVGDYYVIEATAEQLNGNRYVTVFVEGGDANDDFTVIAIRGQSRFPRSGLTAAYAS